MKIAIILGTRPEIIKMSPVIRRCERLGICFFILHTGQHYSYNMDRVFFEQLDLPDAKFNLDVGSATHAEQTGKILIGVEKTISVEKPDLVLVEGDTNTVLAAALASTKLGIKVGHIEAGLRSHDRRMPEEINRVLTDHCSDLLFAPTNNSKKTLIEEGISEDKIFVTGNTIVDAVFQNIEMAKHNKHVIQNLDLKVGEYFLVTIHRQENADYPERFKGIIEGLKLIKEKFGMPVIFPIHPRARKQMLNFNYDPNGIKLIEPLDYLSFLQLEKYSRLILTDSGGVQEEACILRVPCVTLRDNTERPETVEVGANKLAGTKPNEIVKNVKYMLNTSKNWENPFGDGKAGERIIEIATSKIN